MIYGRESSRRNSRCWLILTLLLATLGTALSTGCNSVFDLQEGKQRPICADPLMIDDMEDGEGSICESQGRSGHWWVDSDSTSEHLTPGKNVSFEPTRIADGSRGTSRYAAHFSGFGFTDYGAVMGLDLNAHGSGRDVLDATNMTGVKFWMRSDVPVKVLFDIPETEDARFGGWCSNTAAQNCFNHFAFQITAPSPEWTEYEVPFAALRQLAGSATWNPKQLLGIQFSVGPGAPFEVWVDDIRFYYECKTALCLPTCADPAFPQGCPVHDRVAASCVPAGTECAKTVNWCADPSLIDDMEDGDQAICNSDGRQGWWWSDSDGSSTDLQPARDATFKPTRIPEGRGASHYAARLTGSGFTGYAMMGVDPNYNAPGGYDASAFDGISFWMKSDVPVKVLFPAWATTGLSESGTCDDTGAGTACNNHFQLTVAGTENEWLQYKVPFAALTREQSFDVNSNLAASPGAVDLSHLKSITFLPDCFAFDLWVDDLRFYSCGSGDCVPSCSADAPVACPVSGAHPASCWPAGTDCGLAEDIFIQRGVWASGSDDIWSVGVSNTTWAGSISHWNGVSWTLASVGAIPTISSVWGSAATDVWAVGTRGTILHDDGSGWSLSTSSGSATTPALNALWGSGANDVWAVGGGGTSVRWNGSRWTPVTSATTEALWSVWGSGRNNVWAVGMGGAIVHWDGVAWSRSPSGTTSWFRGVWGSAADDVWAVGYGGTVVHWDGTVWAPVAIPVLHDIFAVWGSAANDVWAVGVWGTIIHWDGTTWTNVPSGTFRRIVALWGNGPNDVWAVGYANTILHWDGMLWSASPPLR
jgi:hypothetical protein